MYTSRLCHRHQLEAGAVGAPQKIVSDPVSETIKRHCCARSFKREVRSRGEGSEISDTAPTELTGAIWYD